MGVTYSQFFPPLPTFTEQNLPSQKGKVFIVTGGASGVGYQLASILFQAGGKVYIAGRSEDSANKSIQEIRALVRNASSASTGQLEYLHLELADLSTIKASAAAFLAKESKLDVLFNNAGVSNPPLGSVSKQGYELQLATNCLGPLLFTQLLLPALHAAVQSSPPGSVRIVWTSPQVVDLTAPKGGMNLADLTSTPQYQPKYYTLSKTGNWYLASEMAKELGPHGIISITQNPGSLKTNLLRHFPRWQRIAASPLMHHPKMGAYTELWAGLSLDVSMEMNGGYAIPWGRPHPAPRQDLLDALKSTGEGGTGQAAEFREWCEKQIADYR